MLRGGPGAWVRLLRALPQGGDRVPTAELSECSTRGDPDAPRTVPEAGDDPVRSRAVAQPPQGAAGYHAFSFGADSGEPAQGEQPSAAATESERRREVRPYSR